MIKNSFIFIPGIGQKTEQKLWEMGILSWDELEWCDFSFIKNKKNVKKYIRNAHHAVLEKKTDFFATVLPPKEYWRLYKEFQDKTLFLDIETTGLSPYYNFITLICTYDGKNIKFFIKDNNLNEIIFFIQNYEIIVTFNGTLFDLPFIKKEIPEIQFPPIHIDLRFLLKSIGINGPLKKVEEKIGIERPTELKELDGKDAVLLWHKFMRGDTISLEKLIYYNIYDTVNLEKLLRFSYNQKVKSILPKSGKRYIQRSLIASSIPSRNRNRVNYLLPVKNTKIPKTICSWHKDLLEVKVNGDISARVDRRKLTSKKISINFLIKQIKKHAFFPTCVGIDLSASEKKASGICVLKENKAYLNVAMTDQEIHSIIKDVSPTLISIDSPLGLPNGRCCVSEECDCRKYGITRECERILRKRGIGVYPCLIKSMQKLTLRGMKISRFLENNGYKVIESYPGAAQDILHFPRKKVSLEELKKELIAMGIDVYTNRTLITHDEIDALTSALVGFFYMADMYEAIGNEQEGLLIIPDLQNWEK